MRPASNRAFRALTLLAPLPLMLRALIGGHGLGDGDLELLFQPFWGYLGDSLRHGRLPLWDPNLGAGLPFVASLQSEALYPPATLLFTLLPLHVATFAFLFGHLYFAAFGTERLARRLGWSEASAAGAGALVACAPMLLSSLVCPSRLAAAAWLPWTWLAGNRACAGRRGGVAALGACVALGLLCGQPEVTLLGALLVGAQAVVRAARGEWGALSRCLIGGLLGVGLSAVVLLPFAELLGQSARAADLQGMERAWSLGRGDLASLLLPFLNLDARWDTFQEIFYGPFQRLIYVVYLGAPAVLLAAVAVRRGGRREWLLVAVAVAALLLAALGGDLSLALERFQLGALAWRYPVKLIYPAAFAVALLAANGAEALANEAGGRIVRALLVAGGALLIAATLGLSRLGNPLGLSLAWVGEGLLALAAMLRWVPPGSWRQWALILFCVADASLCSLRIPFADHGSRCRELLAAARARAGAGRVDATSGVPDGAGFLVAEAGWQNHCLEGNLVAQFGLSSARYYGTPWPKGSQALAGRFGAVGDGLLGVTLVLRGHAEEETPGLVPAAAPELAPLWAAEIPGTSPRVELRPTARVVSEVDAALASETLAQARREVLLAEEPPPPSAPGSPYAGADSAQLLADRGESIEIETAAAAERYLVLADLDYPGWTAQVDGQPAPIRRAYGALRAVRLGPGRHHVRFDYEPRSLRQGLWISLSSAAALLVGAFL